MLGYKLDDAPYFTAPGLAWDAMLKLSKVELLTDIDMIHTLKKGPNHYLQMVYCYGISENSRFGFILEVNVDYP